MLCTTDSKIAHAQQHTSYTQPKTTDQSIFTILTELPLSNEPFTALQQIKMQAKQGKLMLQRADHYGTYLSLGE